jgi:hypothetical protein
LQEAGITDLERLKVSGDWYPSSRPKKGFDSTF